MQVTVRFFAALKDIAGADLFEIEVADGTTLAAVLDDFELRFPALSEYRGRVLTSCNLEYVKEDAVLASGDEIAIFPPVSGG